MIFRPELVREIRAGRKTMTRRPAKTSCRYKRGKTYAVQPGRGLSATCRVLVSSVRRERLGDITYPDAIAEGFRTVDEFKLHWIAVHEKPWLEHENAMLDEAENDDGVILDRDVWIARRSLDLFARRHADRMVWAITFVLDVAHIGRFLALQSDELYTSNVARALPDEPEAVDEDAQQRITRDAGMTTNQWRTLEAAHRDRAREFVCREDQLARVQRAARLRAVDIRRESWALESMLSVSGDAFERKIRKTEQRVFAA